MALPNIEVAYDGVFYSPFTGEMIFSGERLAEPNIEDASLLFLHCVEWVFVNPIVLRLLGAGSMYDLDIDDVLTQLEIPGSFSIGLAQPVSDVVSICGFAPPVVLDKLRVETGASDRTRLRSVK